MRIFINTPEIDAAISLGEIPQLRLVESKMSVGDAIVVSRNKSILMVSVADHRHIGIEHELISLEEFVLYCKSFPKRIWISNELEFLRTPERRSGNTTRMTDAVIQKIFANESVKVVGEHNASLAEDVNAFDKVIRRLSYEHNLAHAVRQGWIQIDHKTCTIHVNLPDRQKVFES